MFPPLCCSYECADLCWVLCHAIWACDPTGHIHACWPGNICRLCYIAGIQAARQQPAPMRRINRHLQRPPVECNAAAALQAIHQQPVGLPADPG